MVRVCDPSYHDLWFEFVWYPFFRTCMIRICEGPSFSKPPTLGSDKLGRHVIKQVCTIKLILLPVSYLMNSYWVDLEEVTRPMFIQLYSTFMLVITQSWVIICMSQVSQVVYLSLNNIITNWEAKSTMFE